MMLGLICIMLSVKVSVTNVCDKELWTKWIEIIDAQTPSFTNDISGELAYIKDKIATYLEVLAEVLE